MVYLQETARDARGNRIRHGDTHVHDHVFLAHGRDVLEHGRARRVRLHLGEGHAHALERPRSACVI